MTDTEAQRFKITMPILKTREKIVKDKKGNEVKERYVEGVASGTEQDKHGDKMSPAAIDSMAKSLKQHVVNLNNEHDTSWSGEIGDITKLEISNDSDLIMEAKLNKMSSASDLWYALTEQNKKLGLSIGGYVKDYEMVKEGKGDDKKWIRLYKEIDLDHIAVTSRPAYPKAWVSVISKSIEENEELLKKEVKAKKENKKEKSKRSEKETKLRELARAIARSIQNLEADLLLELVYKGLTFLNDEQILLLERSVNMAKDVSLEAEEAKKKADASEKPEDEKAENSATPEDESSEKESKVEEEAKEEAEKTADEKEEEESAEKSDEEETEEESSDVTKTEDEPSEEEGDDEAESEESEKTCDDKEDDSGEEKSEKEESEEKSDTEPSEKREELLKAVGKLTEGLKKALKANEELSKRVEELESQPSGRKAAEVEKKLGDDDSEPVDAEALKKERDKKITELKKSHANDPTLFSRIQRVRSDYSKQLRGK